MNILTLGEMEKSDGFCNRCREHEKEFHKEFDIKGEKNESNI